MKPFVRGWCGVVALVPAMMAAHPSLAQDDPSVDSVVWALETTEHLVPAGRTVQSPEPFAVSEADDKAVYNPWNPTPRGQMREMSTDRPDKTESPYSVDAGRFQIELDFLSYAVDEDANLRTESLDVSPVNLKLGLTHRMDLQLIVDTYTRQTITNRVTGARETVDGFGDVTVRLKRNLWGNDHGTTALALMPFVKLPTGSDGIGNDAVEVGIIVPLAIRLSDRIGIGLMTEIDLLQDAEDDGYSPTFVNTATIGFDLTERAGLYTELFIERSLDDDAKWVVTFDVGVTYSATDDIQLDAGFNLGISGAAADMNLFVGVARRF